MASTALDQVLEKLKAYKKKYYLNVSLRGIIFFLATVFSAYLLLTSLEYFGRFNTLVRVIFFFSFLSIALFALVKWVVTPVSKLIDLKKQISDEEAASQIGQYFPQVSDKLLNALQLKQLNAKDNELLLASIQQKTNELSIIPFAEAVSYKDNRKYVKYLAIPTISILSLLIFVPQLLTESTARIVNYNEAYTPAAPFQFLLGNNKLEAYKNEDFELKLALNGSAVPENVYLISNGKRSKMKKNSATEFSYTFKSIQRTEEFIFEAAGFNSKQYSILVISRPDLRFFDTEVNYPAYLGKKRESFKNAGNLTLPEGTDVTWEFGTSDAEKINLNFSSDNKKIILTSKDNNFKYTKHAVNSESYQIQLQNSQSINKEIISYNISIIKDQYPVVNVEKFNDTVLYNYISLGGKISDDYGLRALKLFYRIRNKEHKEEQKYQSLNIPVDAKNPVQNFYYNWLVDSLNINPGESLEYYLQVWDNDGVNGSKSSKSAMFEFKLPTEEEIKEDIAEASNKAEGKMEELLDKTLKLQREINKVQEKMRSQKSMSWQEKRDLENVLKKHEELKKELDELNKKNEQLNEKKEKFTDQDQETAYKLMQLQKMMNEMLDEDTKKLYDELQKMLEEKAGKDQIDKLLEKMDKKDDALKNELDRALEMFKQIKFDQKLNDAIKDLNDLSKKQEDLSQKSLDKKEDSKKLEEQQQKLNEDFKKVQEELKDLKDINESLENKKDLEETEKDEKSIEEDQKNSKEELKENQKSKASKSQKKASKEMKDLEKKLSQMKQDNESKEAEENMEDLRAILDNLITLSFDQEALMKDFKKVSQSDPRYIQLSQKQLKLKDDSKIIEDSLKALAKRVFQIEAFVTREVNAMKGYMDESMDAIKARRSDLAAGKQQFAMTSINNLALMLNDVLKQMQQQMADAQNKPGGGQCKKPGKNNKPGLGDIQKQLNQSIEQLKKGGKTGRALSEELAKLSSQQEAIRKALKEMEGGQGKNGKTPGNELSEMKKMMEETEKDLVNKRITQETVNRQKEILTRLLESEKAARERELDNKREANTAKEKNNDVPPSFEKYLKAKEKQVDLLKTVPPSLNPYYKQEVNEYFQKLEK